MKRLSPAITRASQNTSIVGKETSVILTGTKLNRFIFLLVLLHVRTSVWVACVEGVKKVLVQDLRYFGNASEP